MKRYILTIASALMLMPASIFAQGFSSPLSTEKKPWTAVPQIKSDDYKFVVIPDKKGGDETGVFDVAIQEINRLAPDFVINIGDLIEGFVSDVSYTVPMWDDIFGRLEKLDAPFFLVGGNHDLSSEALTEDYIKRFGATYYSFNVGPDLFLVLDSEEHGGRDISDTQVKYFENILKGWNGRHIYVFMHAPLWAPTCHGGYEEIDAMLQVTNFTSLLLHKTAHLKAVKGRCSCGKGRTHTEHKHKGRVILYKTLGDKRKLTHLSLLPRLMN